MRTAKKNVLGAFAAFALLTMISPALLAQAQRGSISGTVADQLGGKVSGAEVSLLHSQQALLNTNKTTKISQRPLVVDTQHLYSIGTLF